MLFYDCSTAPNPRRARMFIAEKGLEIESRDISMIRGEQLSPEFLKINPLGTIPVLVTDAGNVLTENIAIAVYLEEVRPDPPLLGRTAEERAMVFNWNAVVEHEGGQPIAEAFRNSHPAMKGRAVTGPEDFEQIPALAERAFRRIDLFFDLIEDRLKESEYLAGDVFSLADITAFVMIEFARVVKRRIPEDNAASRRWHAAVKARPSAAACAVPVPGRAWLDRRRPGTHDRPAPAGAECMEGQPMIPAPPMPRQHAPRTPPPKAGRIAGCTSLRHVAVPGGRGETT
ncbi:MAG TPA: glutathione S-transferase [Thermopetrobacter sp.]|nr:glutathione S-transferase [Thermopetrobacter sp.]